MARGQLAVVMVTALSFMRASQGMRTQTQSQTMRAADTRKQSQSTTTTCASGYTGCFDVEGCVYVPKGEYAKLEEFPELLKLVGKCVHQSEVFARVAPGIQFETEEDHGDSVRVKSAVSKTGDRWLPIASLCGEEQAWTSPQCARLCPPTTGQDECIGQRGCVFVEGDNQLSQIPEAFREALGPTFGMCVAANGLMGSSPEQSEWITLAGDAKGEGVTVIASEGRKLLAFPEIVEHDGEDDALIKQKCVLGEDANRHVHGSSWPAVAQQKENLLQACSCHYWRHVKNSGEVYEVTTDFHYATANPDNFLLIDYGCWRNVLSKSLRMPVQFEYVASADKGNHERLDVFALDETEGLLEWQPPVWSRSDKYGKPYDVGHLVMANHFDSYRELIHATNLMTNVLPQLGDMNRFAWLATEYITECAREGEHKENVHVVGGCVWPEQPEDYIEGFEKMWKPNPRRKHAGGYRLFIPDYCWKVLSTPNRGHVAFYIPNTVEAKISKVGSKGPDGVERGLTALSQFVVSLSELEGHLSSRQTPQTFTLPAGTMDDKNYKPTDAEMQENGWSLNCDKK